MYMITSLNFQHHATSLRFFDTLEDVQRYLQNLRRFDDHAMAPSCYKIHVGDVPPEPMSTEWLRQHIWPHTPYNKEHKARKEDLTKVQR